MFKLFTPAFVCVLALAVNAQTQPVNTETQPFGTIDKADLESTACDFEKDANAEVLFDVADAYYTNGATLDYHKRIKIFNDKGNHEASIRLEYFSIANFEFISGLEAETINLADGKIEITKVDKKQIFTERVDAQVSAIVFAFPNVKAGSVIEYKYRLNTQFLNIPDWYFQSDIPERYNELTVSIPNRLYYKAQLHTNQPLVKDISKEAAGNLNTHTYAMADVPSFNNEPFMSSRQDNIESTYFQITGVYGNANFQFLFNTWDKVGKYLIENQLFGYEMNKRIPGQTDVLKNVKLLPAIDQKIAYIFNLVKNEMKADGVDRWYTNYGAGKAWELKAGNGTEINLILHSLLAAAGIEAYPFLVSTHKNGKINPAYPNINQFNRAVVYVKADNGNIYILDASNKYNVYNEPPADLLNSFGLLVDNDHQNFKTIFIENKKPVREVVFVNAEIKPNGAMEGIAQKSSYSYLKNRIAESYKKNGEKVYRESLKGNNNSMSIVDLKLENLNVDSLPLKQQITFKSEGGGSGEDYIYFNPNIFSAFKKNPFLSEKRLTDIDFSYLSSYSIIGVYKLPVGYKIEALPKSISLVMPDKSISFTRIVAQQDGSLSVRYMIDEQKSIFFKEDYAGFKEFYKKMYELLNEQIVLKKL